MLVPHSGKGKNALDFHLSFYLGYVAAKHPEANLMVVANDKGYDSMIGHAKLLGFTATRVGFKAKKAPAAKKAAAPAKKAVAAKARQGRGQEGRCASAADAPPKSRCLRPPRSTGQEAGSGQAGACQEGKAAPAPQKKAKNAGQPAKAPPAKKAPAKSAAAGQAAPAKKTASQKSACQEGAGQEAGSDQAAPTKQAPVTKAAASPADKVMTRATKALSKMGKNRPTKLSKLLRHLKSMRGAGRNRGRCRCPVAPA